MTLEGNAIGRLHTMKARWRRKAMAELPLHPRLAALAITAGAAAQAKRSCDCRTAQRGRRLPPVSHTRDPLTF